jgi:hypothetical protein
MTNEGETDEDMANAEAWAEVILAVMFPIPMDMRLAILAIVQRELEEKVAELGANGGLVLRTIVPGEYEKSRCFRHHGAIKRLISLVIQVLVRRITNNNSPQDAAKLLFAYHRHGHGSGQLLDYLERPQSIAKTAHICRG